MKYAYSEGVGRDRNLTVIGMVAFVLAFVIAVAIVIKPALAMTSTALVVAPESSLFDAGDNVVGVSNDAAPGFASGSIASDGSGKTDLYLTPEYLFGRNITLGEIKSMSYWTKKDSSHAVNVADWFINIYTSPYVGDESTPNWYGDRIGTEPYFAKNINETVGAWNEWSTDGANNQLRFFESTQGAVGSNFGTYTDEVWSDFITGTALSGETYASRDVLFVSPQTASANANGFNGQIDGLTITLTDGSVATVNFEAFNVVNNTVACKNNGWKTAKDSNGNTSFKNQGACVSYVVASDKASFKRAE